MQSRKIVDASMNTMKMKAVVSGTTYFRKGKDIALFAFEPSGRPGHTVFRLWIDGNWGTYDIEPAWTAVGVANAIYSPTEGPVVVAGDTDGELWEVRAASGEEHAAEIGGDYSELTNLASFDNAIWACGMGRVVLRREAGGTWADLSAPDPAVDLGVIGFAALASAGRGEVVAVGWQGEIWLRHTQWDAQESGTKANLNAVSVGADGQIVAVGDRGVIVVGRRNQWSVIKNDDTANLQGVCHFGKQVFIASDFALYRLEQSELVPEDRFADEDEPESCLNLMANEASVFSQGEHDIFRFADGVWKRVF
jgi:hypothetical protein